MEEARVAQKCKTGIAAAACILLEFDSHPAQRVAFVIPALRPLQHR
jgi:hypothetical protein